MTNITINADCSGKKYDVTFTVAKDMTQSDWDQIKQVLQLALNMKS